MTLIPMVTPEMEASRSGVRVEGGWDEGWEDKGTGVGDWAELFCPLDTKGNMDFCLNNPSALQFKSWGFFLFYVCLPDSPPSVEITTQVLQF